MAKSVGLALERTGKVSASATALGWSGRCHVCATCTEVSHSFLFFLLWGVHDPWTRAANRTLSVRRHGERAIHTCAAELPVLTVRLQTKSRPRRNSEIPLKPATTRSLEPLTPLFLYLSNRNRTFNNEAGMYVQFPPFFLLDSPMNSFTNPSYSFLFSLFSSTAPDA